MPEACSPLEGLTSHCRHRDAKQRVDGSVRTAEAQAGTGVCHSTEDRTVGHARGALEEVDVGPENEYDFAKKVVEERHFREKEQPRGGQEATVFQPLDNYSLFTFLFILAPQVLAYLD